MRAPEDPVRHVLPTHSKGAQRRRRLARGLMRWDFDRQLCAEPTRRVARITLTIAEDELEVAIGHVREFWAKVRKRWLGTRYFCWLELQARGQVHYHCVLLNPPHVKRVNLLRWVDNAWSLGRTQVRFSDGHHGMQRELNYALGHAKKMGKKSYQQRYDDVPSQLRTFMSQRLEIPPKVIDGHLDQELYSWHPGNPPETVSRDNSRVNAPAHQDDGKFPSQRWKPFPGAIKGVRGDDLVDELVQASPRASPAGYLRYEGTRAHIVVDLRWCTAQLYRRGSKKEKPPLARGLSKQVAGRLT